MKPTSFEEETHLKEIERKDFMRLQGIDDADGNNNHEINPNLLGRDVEWGGPPKSLEELKRADAEIDMDDGWGCYNKDEEKIDLCESIPNSICNPEPEEPETVMIDTTKGGKSTQATDAMCDEDFFFQKSSMRMETGTLEEDEYSSHQLLKGFAPEDYSYQMAMLNSLSTASDSPPNGSNQIKLGLSPPSTNAVASD